MPSIANAVEARTMRRVTLRIEPWESEAVQERLGSLNRVELDDVDLLSLPAFFGEPVTQGAKAP